MTDPRDEALSAAVAAGLKRGGSLEDQYRAAIRAYLAHEGLVERVRDYAPDCSDCARASLAAITPEAEHD